jgi:putative endonuclease
MSNAHALGKSGEAAALAYLKKKKFRIIEQGFRFHRGEIDIIGYDRGTLVFVEVKTRRSSDFGLPEESVTSRKQSQIRNLAAAYLAVHNLEQVPCRFDILALFYTEKEGFKIRHIADAF